MGLYVFPSDRLGRLPQQNTTADTDHVYPFVILSIDVTTLMTDEKAQGGSDRLGCLF